MFFEPLFGGVQTLKDLACELGGFEDIEDMQNLDKDLVVKIHEAIDKSVEVEGDYVVFHLATPYPPSCRSLLREQAGVQSSTKSG